MNRLWGGSGPIFGWPNEGRKYTFLERCGDRFGYVNCVKTMLGGTLGGLGDVANEIKQVCEFEGHVIEISFQTNTDSCPPSFCLC